MQGFVVLQKKNESYEDLNMREIEYVGVHIRRTDYIHHVKSIYKNATQVSHEFYNNAFAWLEEQVETTLIFIVITDDMKWAEENIAQGRSDVFMPGKEYKILSYYYIKIKQNVCMKFIFKFL